MLLPMIALTLIGLALLIGAPILARLIVGRGKDTVGLTRVFQTVAVVLLIGALLIRPRNLETTAVPQPPDAVPASQR